MLGERDAEVVRLVAFHALDPSVESVIARR
jgi:hypothetical protein